MTLSQRFAALAAATALVAVPLAPALAQETAPAPQGSAAVTDGMIDSFVTAALNVSEVADTYQPRIDAADDDAERAAMAEEARVAMVSAVEGTEGITVEEYIAISDAARADPELNDRILERLQDRSAVE